MATQVASLYADIGAKTDGFTKGAATVKSGLGSLVGGFISSTAVITAFASAVNFSIDAASEAQQVDAQLAATLQSTGSAAGMSRDRLEELATSLSKVTTYDDEAIKSSEALLLTFTKVGSEAFPQATQAILDMSTALGTDLNSATLQVGKALNDPIKGITALSRAGVSFTAEQNQLIGTLVETGDVLGAQKIILNELSKEFGGSASAAANTYAGQITQLKNELGNLGEAIGSEALPELTTFIKEAKTAVEWVTKNYEEIKKWADVLAWLANPLGKAGAELGAFFRHLVFGEDAVVETTNAVQAQADVLNNEYIPTLDEVAAANEKMQESYANWIDGAIDITSRNKDFAASQQEILDNIAATRAEGENLYPWEAEKIAENQGKLEELGQAYFDNLEDFKAAMQEKFTLYAVEQIAMSDGVEGFSAAEFEKARIILETTDVATAAAFEEQQAMAMLAQAVSDGTVPVQEWGSILDTVMADGVVSVGEVQAAIDAVPKQNTVTFDIITNGAPPNLDVSTDASSAPKGTHRNSHALGGNFAIPSSYGTEGFLLGNGDTASGGELISITPRGQSNGNADIIAAIERNKLDVDRLAQLLGSMMVGTQK